MSYQYIKPTDEEIKIMQQFRDEYEKLNKKIFDLNINGRGISLCRTNLEQSAMWLNKAITKND